MSYSIKQFSTLLVIHYSKLPFLVSDLINSDDFKNHVFIKEILAVIDFLLNYHKESIDVEISIEKFEHILGSKEMYMKHLLARCLKLSEGKHPFLEFLLVCVYICKIAECVFAKYKCCKVLKLTADCLEAVYCRKYWTFFNDNDGFSGLSKFCESYNPFSVKKKGCNFMTFFSKCISCFRISKQEWNEQVEYFKSLNDIVGDGVSLNKMEKKKLVDESFFRPDPWANVTKDFLIDRGEQGATSDCEKKEWIVPEKSNKHFQCDYCKAPCFVYLDHLYD